MAGVCLFGGAFDPPHLTHRRIIEAALAQLAPERLLVLPCGDHPLKPTANAPAEHRLEMCRIAFADLDPRVEIDDRELRREGRSFTIDTVRQLRAETGFDGDLWLLIGADNAAGLDRWRDHHSLLELVTPVVFPRAGHRLDERALNNAALRRRHKQALLDNRLEVPADDINSTAIRERLAGGQDCSDVCDPAVIAYARKHGLYPT